MQANSEEARYRQELSDQGLEAWEIQQKIDERNRERAHNEQVAANEAETPKKSKRAKSKSQQRREAAQSDEGSKDEGGNEDPSAGATTTENGPVAQA